MCPGSAHCPEHAGTIRAASPPLGSRAVGLQRCQHPAQPLIHQLRARGHCSHPLLLLWQETKICLGSLPVCVLCALVLLFPVPCISLPITLPCPLHFPAQCMPVPRISPSLAFPCYCISLPLHFPAHCISMPCVSLPTAFPCPFHFPTHYISLPITFPCLLHFPAHYTSLLLHFPAHSSILI